MDVHPMLTEPAPSDARKPIKDWLKEVNKNTKSGGVISTRPGKWFAPYLFWKKEHTGVSLLTNAHIRFSYRMWRGEPQIYDVRVS